MTIFEKLLSKFDHIFLLTRAERKDRYYGILTLLRNLGYDENNIEHIKKFDIVYTTGWKYNGIICTAINQHFKNYVFTKPNEYDCTRNHYNIIKTSYYLGYEKILVLEDDICFIKERRFNDFLNNFPEDYSMVQMSGFSADSSLLDELKKEAENGVLFVPTDKHIWCTAMYALSREGMKHYINFIDNVCTVADTPLYEHPNTGYYCSVWPLAIQADKNIIASDIRDNQNDKIDYTTENKYEWKSKTLYEEYSIQ